MEMLGVYIFLTLFIVGVVLLIVFKIKWGRADAAAERSRLKRIQEEQIETADKAEGRGR